jgi:hypothetical protein
MRLPGATELLAYFERTNREYPNRHWENGAEICRRWLTLQGQENVSQSEIDAIMSRLKSEPNYGSGWFDLEIQFSRWARQRGLRA